MPKEDGSGANQLYLLLRDIRNAQMTTNGYLLSKIKTSKGVFSVYLGISKSPEQGEVEKGYGYSLEYLLHEMRENNLENEIDFVENAHIRIMNDDDESFLSVVFSSYEDALVYVEKYLDGGI